MQQGVRTLMQDANEKAFKGFTDVKATLGDSGKVIP
jgi:hypothetical protein